MSFVQKQPRKRHDRRDGVRVADIPSLNIVMANLFPKRADNEVYLHQEIDVTEMMRYIQQKNTPDAPYKTTIFHCFVAMVARVVNERPFLNRFIQGGRVYQRDEIIVSFVAKRRFSDHSEEALMQYRAKAKDNLKEISHQISGEVRQMRQQKHAEGLDEILDKLAAMPRFGLLAFMKGLRWLDYWGMVPEVLMKGDSNYSSVLLSNLGSIQCPSVYHHLNNYGTNSVMITIGALHKANVRQPDGTYQERELVDIGATLDERIGDGFYFARSLKLFQYISAHPEILDWPLEKPSGFDYK